MAVVTRRRSHTAFGSERERKVARLLEAEGWVVFRSAGSFGVCDLVALREPIYVDPTPNAYGAEARMIEVKGTTRSPWVAWGPAERQALRDAARKAGATPLLAWWPTHGPLQWIGEAEWPA